MSDKIEFLNRDNGQIQLEKVYGESWLRFIYGTIIGKITLWLAVKRAWFSHWYGKKMSKPTSCSKINPFIKKYSLDTSEFLLPVSSFKSFNEFFFRKLKPEARPIDSSSDSIVFPADGRHFGFQNASEVNQIFVKGQRFDLVSLFDSEKIAKPFINGSIVISRLCPVDYHRFHFPTNGRANEPKLLNGFLLSVNPIALRKNISIFWKNKRYLSILNDSPVGNVATFLVGATCVGSVKTTVDFPCSVKKGDEFGYFLFGGSCVITIFEVGKVNLSNDLLETSRNGIELYAKMGQILGSKAT